MFKEYQMHFGTKEIRSSRPRSVAPRWNDTIRHLQFQSSRKIIALEDDNDNITLQFQITQSNM